MAVVRAPVDSDYANCILIGHVANERMTTPSDFRLALLQLHRHDARSRLPTERLVVLPSDQQTPPRAVGEAIALL